MAVNFEVMSASFWFINSIALWMFVGKFRNAVTIGKIILAATNTAAFIAGEGFHVIVWIKFFNCADILSIDV